ncbi:hypothetical protein OQA88_5379 [Cercophora sp. LCS_1]
MFDRYNWWSFDSFFEITLGFGSLTFTQAKVIDIAWDVLVGRFGQAVMAHISWNVFADYVATSMAKRPTSYTTFWIVYLQREPSPSALLQLVREFSHEGMLNSKLAMGFIVTTIAFLISFPTFASAMSGYTPASRAYIRRNDSSFVSFRELRETSYVIHDGSRIGLTDDYAVPLDEGDVQELLSKYDPTIRRDGRANVSSYVSKYGFNGLANVETEWMSKKVDPPALNITGFYFRLHDDPQVKHPQCYGYDWVDPQTGQNPYRNPENRAYQDSRGDLYTLDYVKANGVCHPVTEPCERGDVTANDKCTVHTFLWGFSFIQTFILTVLALLWSCGLYVMWLKSHLQLPFQGSRETPCGWRALMHLGETMRAELDRLGIDPNRLTDKELKKRIRNKLQGGPISFHEPLQNPEAGFWNTFRSWIKHGKWWLAAFTVTTALAVPLTILLYHRYPLASFLFCGLSVGLFWSMALGRTPASRFTFAGIGLAVGLGLGAIAHTQIDVWL